MVDLALATAAISAAASAIGLIDKVSDQIERFMARRKEPMVPKEHRMKFEREGNALVSKSQGKKLQTITAKDFQKLPEASLHHIQVLEKSMENHYSVWAAVYPQLALAIDPIAKAKTELQLRDVIAGMKSDLDGILDFLQQSGFYLDDHYQRVRNLVRSV
jgi:hypothetical protein